MKNTDRYRNAFSQLSIKGGKIQYGREGGINPKILQGRYLNGRRRGVSPLKHFLDVVIIVVDGVRLQELTEHRTARAEACAVSISVVIPLRKVRDVQDAFVRLRRIRLRAIYSNPISTVGHQAWVKSYYLVIELPESRSLCGVCFVEVFDKIEKLVSSERFHDVK